VEKLGRWRNLLVVCSSQNSVHKHYIAAGSQVADNSASRVSNTLAGSVTIASCKSNYISHAYFIHSREPASLSRLIVFALRHQVDIVLSLFSSALFRSPVSAVSKTSCEKPTCSVKMASSLLLALFLSHVEISSTLLEH